MISVTANKLAYILFVNLILVYSKMNVRPWKICHKVRVKRSFMHNLWCSLRARISSLGNQKMTLTKMSGSFISFNTPHDAIYFHFFGMDFLFICHVWWMKTCSNDTDTKNVDVVLCCTNTNCLLARIYCMWHSSSNDNDDDEETHTEGDAITFFLLLPCHR